jgi:hypothetical protein
MKKNHKIAVVIFLSLVMIGLFMSIFITVEKAQDNAVVSVTEEDKFTIQYLAAINALWVKNSKNMSL